MFPTKLELGEGRLGKAWAGESRSQGQVKLGEEVSWAWERPLRLRQLLRSLGKGLTHRICFCLG